ncbi:MAG: ABC transporter ATP-binding protein/permease [Lachnospiraceae bacterium]|nr:ABC transporter ATP-binding protein/permease [Lachnospiraceae bacterium]
MKKILKKLRMLLSRKQKWQMAGLVVMMLIGAVLETGSIALVLSTVSVLVEPEGIENNLFLHKTYAGFGFTDKQSFTVFIMVLLIFAFVLKSVFLFLEWKAMYAFVYRNQFETSERMLKSYLRKNYEYYLFADTAVIQRSITSDVNNMFALILALLTITSEIIVFVSLVLVLLLVDPLMCIVFAVLILSVMIFMKKVLKPVMIKAGKDNSDYYAGLFKWISQIVQGIKDVKVTGSESYFVEEYKKCGMGYVNAVQKYSLYNNTPKLVIETVGIAGMILYIIYLVINGADITAKLPAFSAFAVAAVKLMPSANKINNQLNQIAYTEPFFMGVSDTLQDDINNKNTDMSFAEGPVTELPIKKEIVMEHITYKYPETTKLIFDDAGITIPVGTAVGIVGTTGSGKTTIVDILLGLLKPEGGRILADGTDIRSNFRGWLNNVGYIPQMIYMLDDTIAGNVCFGSPVRDEARIWEVLKEAHLDEFVKGLPEGLETKIGERGIRISGGQRQRIGIARALYNDPEVLILDEATSALDNDTEAAIMESINALHGRKTLIIIAHRLETIKKCDVVYRVQDGKITKEKEQ